MGKEKPDAKSVGEVYQCETCGNVVEVRKAGNGEMVCCGESSKKRNV